LYSTVAFFNAKYIAQKKYKEAEELLIKCISKLNADGTHLNATNLGYAYLWLSEVMKETNRERETVAFYYLAKQVWKEHAPLLVPVLDEIKLSIVGNPRLLEEMDLQEAEKFKDNLIQTSDS
jgi:hypothetical protein